MMLMLGKEHLSRATVALTSANPAHVYRLSSGHGWSDGMVQTLSGL